MFIFSLKTLAKARKKPLLNGQFWGTFPVHIQIPDNSHIPTKHFTPIIIIIIKLGKERKIKLKRK